LEAVVRWKAEVRRKKEEVREGELGLREENERAAYLERWNRGLMWAAWVMILLGLLAMGLAGCSSGKRSVPIAAPDLMPVKRAVAVSRVKVVESKGNVDRARSAVEEARGLGVELLRVSPPDLRPLVAELQAKLDVATEELEGARSRLAEAEAELFLTDGKLERAQVTVDKLHARAGELQDKVLALQDKLEATTAERNTWRKKTLQWRLGALVAVVIAGGWTFRRPIGAMLGVPVP
jgi:hypothetical protein